MGFWSSVGSVVKGAAENIAATSQEAKVIAEGYRSEDDDYLKRKLKNGRAAEKLAAAQVLKERGYGQS